MNTTTVQANSGLEHQACTGTWLGAPTPGAGTARSAGSRGRPSSHADHGRMTDGRRLAARPLVSAAPMRHDMRYCLRSPLSSCPDVTSRFAC